MTSATHTQVYRRTANYGREVAGFGVWNDRGRSLISRTAIEKDARRGAQMYAAAMRGELKSYLENESNHNAR